MRPGESRLVFGMAKLVEPGCDEGAARVETTRCPVVRTWQQVFGHARDGFDEASSQSEQAGSTNFPLSKPVGPGCEERAARVETIRCPAGGPDREAVVIHVLSRA